MAETNCPECGGPIVGGGDGGWVTCVGYSSPPGHNHDDNCETRTYWCGNGHRFTLSKRARCGVMQPDGTRCEWVGQLTCFCHPGEKIDAWPVIQAAQWVPEPPPAEVVDRPMKILPPGGPGQYLRGDGTWADPPARAMSGPACIDCGHRMPTSYDHHKTCDCTTCDVPG
jgi:hypothetical protein